MDANKADPKDRRMITPYLSNYKIDKLDKHVELGAAKSRSDLIRVCIDFWLDNHPLPEEIEVLRMQATVKQVDPPTPSPGGVTSETLARGIEKAVGKKVKDLPWDFYYKISQYLIGSYKIE
jgi:Arc/MetJ-type ribon-helix-helix transcriptional regulator